MRVRDSLTYEEKKAALTLQVKSGCGPLVLGKARSNLFRPRTRIASDQRLDVKKFNSVLFVDRENKIAEVEGMATYETIVEETLKYGCLPTVVPELKGITIGGALTGCGIESSSFRYGLVHETIEESELLLSDGTVVTANRAGPCSDLFKAFPNSYGTLGYAIKVKVKLVPVKPYVKLTHTPFTSKEAFFSELARLCKKRRGSVQDSYLEGVIFDEKNMWITTADFVNEAPYLSCYRHMNIYYRSIMEKSEDYLTTHDYIWRWDSDWFWCSRVFGMQHKLMRKLFGRWMLNSKAYAKIMHYFNARPRLSYLLSKVQGRRESIIQDVTIPADRAEEFYTFFQEKIGITPIWICPSQGYNPSDSFTFCPMDGNRLYYDFGFWDSIPSDKPAGYYNRLIEAEVKKLKGFKSLYSSSFYTEEEFWDLYDKSAYQELKNKYDPEGRLRDLYMKCTTR